MKRTIVPVSLCSVALVVTLEPSPQPPPQSIQAKLDRVEVPFDAPREAFEFYRAKRLAGASARTTAGLYRRAERRLESMRRYSTRLGRFVADERAAFAKDHVLDGWEFLGPGNIGGRTRVLVIHPERTRTMYAAGVSGGIWKTTNAGKRWKSIGDALGNLAVNSLAMDPADPEVLYAGTGEGYFREVVRETVLPLRGGGIFKSEDGGDTWARLPSTKGKKFHWVNDIIVSRHDSSRLYAATRKGVYRSKNGGGKWRRVLRPKARGGCLDLAVREDAGSDFLFASCGTLNSGDVYRKVAAEKSGKWDNVLNEAGMGRTSLAIAPSNQDVVYALASSTVPGPGGNFLQGLHAVFRSDEGGAEGTWEATVRNDDPRVINTLILSNPVIALLEECGFQGPNEFFSMGWYVNTIAVDPRDPDRVWAGGVDLLRSDDGGRNWNPATYWWSGGGPRFVHADQHGVVFHPTKPNTLYSLNDGGVFRTTNPNAQLDGGDLAVCDPNLAGVSWTSLNNSYGVTQFYHGAAFPNAKAYLAGAQDNGTILGRDRNGANGWFRVNGGDGGYSAVDPTNTDILYATSQNGRVYKSTDQGSNFEESVSGIDDLATNNADDFRAVGDNFLFISPLVMDPQQPNRLWSGGKRLWRTDSAAISWDAASTDLAGRASAIAIAQDDSDTVLVGTEEGTVHRSSSATPATSADGTAEWPGSRPRKGFVSSVAFDPLDPSVTYATYADFGGDHVWRSVDGGESWVSLDGKGKDGVPNIPVHSIVIDPLDRDRLFLGTDLGVLVSTDGGESWAAENTGFVNAVTESLSLVETPDGETYLFAFTHGRGAWRVRLQ